MPTQTSSRADREHDPEAPAGPSSFPEGSAGPLEFDRLYAGDCLELLPRVASGSIDLVFADPPFNIGYDYDVYDDRLEAQAYLDWTRSWGREVVRALKPDGTFWLAIGDEYRRRAEGPLPPRARAVAAKLGDLVLHVRGQLHEEVQPQPRPLVLLRAGPQTFYFQRPVDSCSLGAATGLLRLSGQPRRPSSRRHLDSTPAGRPRRLRSRERHLVRPAGLRHLQGTRRLARLPDARTASGPDHPRLLEPRRRSSSTPSAAAVRP